jgi:hypothetical protein
MDTISVILIVIIIVMLCKCTEKYANSPYTVPYMEEKISPMANFKCIYPTIPLVPNRSYSQT